MAQNNDVSLDPADWDRFRTDAHAALDAAIDRLTRAGEGPVWRKTPTATRAQLAAGLPRESRELADVLADVETHIVPYVTGNTHPMFMGWVHGAGTPVGMVGEMIAAGLNANCGGRDHVGIEVERQVVRWMAEMLGFPSTASGVFVTGTSMANFLAVRVAMTVKLGVASRKSGVRRLGGQPTAYASTEAHGCINQALELAGIGSDNLRLVPVDRNGAIEARQLEEALIEDRERGALPFLLVGTAGTVNTGAFDNLEALADIARRTNLWLHIDGAFGALAALAPSLRSKVKGLENAQSVAFDFHKWAHVPYDAGFLLVRDAAAHRAAFANPAAYLSRSPRGLAAGETWPCDLGPDLSRGFRALKTWMTIQALGADRIGAAIERCCALARHLEQKIAAEPLFELAAPVALNIVCWRVRGPAAQDAINEAVMMDLHEQGVAVPSLTRIGGRPALRAAIVNHRTGEAHIDRLVEAARESARRLGA